MTIVIIIELAKMKPQGASSFFDLRRQVAGSDQFGGKEAKHTTAAKTLARALGINTTNAENEVRQQNTWKKRSVCLCVWKSPRISGFWNLLLEVASRSFLSSLIWPNIRFRQGLSKLLLLTIYYLVSSRKQRKKEK